MGIVRNIISLLYGLACLTACNDPAEEQLETETPAPTAKPTAIEIKSDKLGGTYVNAGAGAPVIIIVPGSGPTDKDGNNGNFVSNAYKFLAEDLAKTGISSVRVDKRGMFSSAGAGDPEAVSVDLYAEDYRQWVETVTDHTGQPCAYLLGHSEGGLMVTAAAIDREDVCGVIAVAAPGRRLSEILRDQLKANPANAIIMDDAMNVVASLEGGETVDVSNMHPALQGLFDPAIQDFWISLFAVDPAQLMAKLDVPKLVIQGRHDFQVSVEDATRLSEIGGAKLVLLDGINHVLKPAPAERLANIMTYNSPNTPIDPGVVQAIAEFVKSP